MPAHPTSCCLWLRLLGVKTGTHAAQRCLLFSCSKARPPWICAAVASAPSLYAASDFTQSVGLMSLSLKTFWKQSYFSQTGLCATFLKSVYCFCFWFWLCCLMLLWSLNFTTGPIFYIFILFLPLIADVYLRALKPFRFKAQNKVIFIDTHGYEFCPFVWTTRAVFRIRYWEPVCFSRSISFFSIVVMDCYKLIKMCGLIWIWRNRLFNSTFRTSVLTDV